MLSSGDGIRQMAHETGATYYIQKGGNDMFQNLKGILRQYSKQEASAQDREPA